MSLIYHNIIGIEEIYRYMSISVYKLSVYRGYTVKRNKKNKKIEMQINVSLKIKKNSKNTFEIQSRSNPGSRGPAKKKKIETLVNISLKNKKKFKYL